MTRHIPGTSSGHHRERQPRPAHSSHAREPLPEVLHCATCAMEWEVSPEDPDSTLDDARLHVARRHPAEQWDKIIHPGTTGWTEGKP